MIQKLSITTPPASPSSATLLTKDQPVTPVIPTVSAAKKNQIPILITSNLGQKEDIDRGMKLGAIDFVVKSDMSLDDLIKKIQSHLK